VAFDEYFDERASRFNAFYRSERVSRAIGRGALIDRLQFAVDVADAIAARIVLDVGCGSGPLFEPLATRGIQVRAIDPAPAMVALATASARRLEGDVVVEERGWESLHAGDRADLAVALGVFDDVEDARPLLERLA